jgi:hypothetical protein
VANAYAPLRGGSSKRQNRESKRGKANSSSSKMNVNDNRWSRGCGSGIGMSAQKNSYMCALPSHPIPAGIDCPSLCVMGPFGWCVSLPT